MGKKAAASHCAHKLVDGCGAALALLLMPACSLLFEPASTGGVDEDGGPDVDGSSPLQAGQVWEGTGAIPAGQASTKQRPHILVVRGRFSEDTVITLRDAGAIEVGPTTVSSNGTIAATTLRVPVMLDLGQDDEPLGFDILASSGDVESPKQLVVQGLDELQQRAELETDGLRARYSLVELGSTKITGSAPARLFSTSSIVINGIVSVSAVNAAPGPGACAGGSPGVSAECGSSGGNRGGLTNGGGGGGSHGEFGSAGLRAGVDDQTFGQPGTLSGTPMLIPLDAEGGAGGGGSGGAEGASGGGGGGVIELHAEGSIIFGPSALITAVGGNGGSASCAANQGGGGGGAGGAILVRSHTSLQNNTGQLGILLVSGGAGDGESLCVGGDGGAGRIRIDPPEASLLGSGSAYGAMWSPAAPTIVTSPLVALELWGGTDRSHGVTVNQGAVRQVYIEGGIVINSTEVSVTLEAGANEICVSPDPAAAFNTDEAWNCIYIAYVPR